MAKSRIKKASEGLTDKEIKKAADELQPVPVEEKKPFDKSEYEKAYNKKKTTIKIYNEFHTKAIVEAKKRFMSISKYIEYLINEDTKNS